MPEPAHLSAVAEVKDVDLVFFHRPQAGGPYHEFQLDEHDDGVPRFQERRGLKALNVERRPRIVGMSPCPRAS